MVTTSNLSLPYILAAQAQKHVTHNEAIRALDAIVQLSVLDRDLATPPGSPSEGDRYIVAPAATDGWSGHDGHIAAFQDGAWAFYTPVVGWVAWITDESTFAVWDGGQWAQPEMTNPVSLVGINTVADPVNRLSVKSDAVLLSHEDTGSNAQLKVNKSGAADTASLLFQTGFSGRAEFGTTGDDDFHIKVSADGSNWHESIVVDRNTGVVDFPSGTTATGTGPSGLARYITNRTGPNLHDWTRSLRRMLQSGERPRINIYGDSIALGTGGQIFSHSPGSVLAGELTRRGYPARSNVFGLSLGSVSALAAYDNRWSFSGSWSGWTAVQGKQGMRASSAGAAVTYAPGYEFDRIELHHIQQATVLGGGGEFTITVDGGATQFSTPTSGGLVTSQTIVVPGLGGSNYAFLDISVTIDGPPATHTITLTNGATGVFELYGFDPWNSTTPEISVRVAAGSGLSSADLSTGSAAQSIWRLPCDLYMLCIGRNDSNGDVATATYGANLDLMESNMRVLANASLLYWTPPPAAASVKPISQQQTYVDEMAARAGSDIVLFDQFQRWLDRGGQEALAEGSGGDWYDDTIHPSQWGNHDIARALTDLILWEDR